MSARAALQLVTAEYEPPPAVALRIAYTDEEIYAVFGAVAARLREPAALTDDEYAWLDDALPFLAENGAVGPGEHYALRWSLEEHP